MMSITHTHTQTDTKSERVPYLAKLGEKIAELGRQEESRSVTHLIRMYIYIYILYYILYIIYIYIYVYIYIYIYIIFVYIIQKLITPLKEEHFISNLINSYTGYAYRKIRR